MKRDPDLIRELLQLVEDQCDGVTILESRNIKLGEYSSKQISYHIAILGDAGLIMAQSPGFLGGRETNWNIQRLTWEGHEFLAAAGNDQRWETVKKAMSQVGGFAYEVAKPVLVEMLKTQLQKMPGVL